MNIFISWSGDKSKKVAENLRDFIKVVIQATNLWVSSTNITSGDRWNEEISKKLSDSTFGIICLTLDNLNSPWILFEAGALAKSVDKKTYVCPYLIDFDSSQLESPLSIFQAKKANKSETLSLLRDINGLIKKTKSDMFLDEKALENLFEKMWPDFESVLNNLPHTNFGNIPKRSSEDMIKEILEITRSINTPEIKDLVSLSKKVDEVEDNVSFLESDKDDLESRVDDLESRVDDLEH